MTILIHNATLVNEGVSRKGSLLIQDDHIAAIIHDGTPLPEADEVVEAEGLLLIPGVIDDHVHFRDPGLTHKADIESESRAAAAGGVTTVMDMPNVVPQTTTNALLKERLEMGRQKSCINYLCYLGATNTNIDEIKAMDTHEVPGVKLFMGSSTGNMLVDKEEALLKLFTESPTLIMTHCEDTKRIVERMNEAKERWGEDPAVEHHPWIRDDEACYQSTALAVRMAQQTGARLHVAHLTTAREAELMKEVSVPATEGGVPQITPEICVAHLVFSDEDYKTLGTRIKCNPAVKGMADRDALLRALSELPFCVVATDHAPHLLSEKQGGAVKAVSGMPMVQFSLIAMLGLADEGVVSREKVVELMCHNPARLFSLNDRGYLREGMKADLALVKHEDWVIEQKDILSKCGWSPLEGRTMHYKVVSTYCNGKKI